MTPAPFGTAYGDRRHYLVARRLEDLRGPTSGWARLPNRLDWSGKPTYNLDKPGNLIVLYQTVLNEATHLDDLSAWLDGPTLVRLWPELWLPSRLRTAWEERFPELAGRRQAAS